jgi:hypothetical protein
MTKQQTVAWLQREAGWGPWIKVTIADTPQADAAAAAFFAKACRYPRENSTGPRDYAAAHVDEEKSTALGPEMGAYFYPICEHQMSAHLCYGPGHYPPDDEFY